MTNIENINYLYWLHIDTMANPRYIFQKIAMSLYNKMASFFKCGAEESFTTLAEIWKAINNWKENVNFDKF